ncbi:MAG: cache domain-containing protein [Rhodospirillales bacterium]
MTETSRKPSLGKTLAFRLAAVSVVATLVLGGLWAIKEYINFAREVDRSRTGYEALQRDFVKDITNSVMRYIRLQQNRIDQDAERSIKARVDEAIVVAGNLYDALKDDLEHRQLQRLVIETWRSMQSSSDEEYIFAFDLENLAELDKGAPPPQDSNLLQPKVGGRQFGVGDILEVVRNSGSLFHSFLWSESADPSVKERKKAFVRQFRPLGLAVGSGIHIADVEKLTKQKAIEFLGQVSYGENGYVFATTWDGLSLSGPASGRNVLDVRDMNGISVVRELIDLAKGGGGYLTYHIPAETGALPVKKVSYVAGVPEWQWYVGAGFDLAIFERDVAKLREAHAEELATILLIVLATVSVLMITIIFAARSQSEKVRQNYSQFMQFFAAAASSRTAIDLRKMRYLEFEEIAQAANEMVETRSTIENNLRESETKLLLAKDEAEESSRAKSEFLANMSHELRTPLNAIAGFSDMIASETFGKLGNPKYLEYAGYIRSSGDHLLSIVNDVLDLSKIEAGKFPMSPVTMPLRAALEDSVALIHFRGRRKADRIVIDIPEDASQVHADARGFRQILINLISNADKYSAPEGLISIRSRLAAGGGILLEIEDEGKGIAPQDLEHVLEPFGQARQSAHITHEGTGLGLSLSKSLMELHGGTLEIESELGKGTIVRLTFPPPPA